MKNFLVTGASKGIGLAVCNQLLSKSDIRVVGLSRSAPPIQHDNFLHFPVDLSQDFPHAEFLAHVDSSWGKQAKFSGLVLNAGISPTLTIPGILEFSTVRGMDKRKLRKVLEVNLISCFDVVSCLLPSLETGSSVIYISSGASLSAMPAWSSYCCSKAAGNVFISCLAMEEPEFTFLSIRPGVVDTPMLQKVLESDDMMPERVYSKFSELREAGKLLDSNIPSRVIARAVLGLDHSVSGSYLSWDDKRLEEAISKNVGNE